MAVRGDRRAAYVAKAKAELAGLVDQGVVMAGNAFSSVLLVKGAPSEEEKKGAPLFSGADGKALRAALGALGYAPEDWVGLSALDVRGAALDPALARLALVTLDPATVIACDEPAADLLRAAFAEELAQVAEFDVAMLRPGLVAHVAGLRLMNVGDFAASLEDPGKKQFAWACLKRLPPLGEPY